MTDAGPPPFLCAQSGLALTERRCENSTDSVRYGNHRWVSPGEEVSPLAKTYPKTWPRQTGCVARMSGKHCRPGPLVDVCMYMFCTEESVHNNLDIAGLPNGKVINRSFPVGLGNACKSDQDQPSSAHAPSLLQARTDLGGGKREWCSTRR